MAGEHSFLPISSQQYVFRQQFNALIESQKAFHEVTLKISDILQDSSRLASYRSIPNEDDHDADEVSKHRENGVKEGNSSTLQLRPGACVDSCIQNEEPPDATKRELTGSSPPWSFEVENARARKAYEQKRRRSLMLYNSVSYLKAEYDFQYKFFPNDVYEQLKRKPEAIGLDPWAWATQSPNHSDVDAYNAYNQLDHRLKLQEAVLNRKSELMEALFPLRSNNMLQCMSWPELEYSCGLHFKDLIGRLGFGKCDNAIGFMDSDITLMIIEIGRFFTELDCSNRPAEFMKGNVPNAMGPFANGPWPKESRELFTFDELHQRCYKKGLMKDWEGNKIRRITFDSVASKGTNQRQAEMLYILEVIFSINKAQRIRWPPGKLISEDESRMFILDFLEIPFMPDEDDYHEQASDQVFAANLLNIQTLRNLGGLDVVWTDSIEDHLRLSIASRTITLFWDVNLLDQSLLFWFNARCLREYGLGPNHNNNSNPRSSVSSELRRTYRLIFHNLNAKQFTPIETCGIKTPNKGPGILIHDLRVNIFSSRARGILKHFLNTPLHRQLISSKPFLSKPTQLRHVWWRINSVIVFFHGLTHRKGPPDTISTHLTTGPPYTLDLCWHLENILTPYPSLMGESETLRSFAHFPRFAPRLREIKFYMDNQKPSGWYQLWKDKRNRVEHVTFWAVLVFGTISIVLALVSIAVSSAQTAAAFRSIGGDGG